jgi:serine phosphatase RsbU (regulator of sigma subunit)
MNSEGQFFGTTRVMKLIEKHYEATATEIADVILREVDWFTQSAPLADDRTLVVAKVR